jgi:hypothetical protein
MPQSLPKVVCPLVGEDGNAFAILGRFQRAARSAGWSREDISKVIDEAKSGDYNHLLCTIMEHSEEPEEKDEDGYEYDDEE